MGCDKYFIDEGNNDFIKFDEMDDEWACLCTFPFGEKLDADDVRSFALLGVALVLYNRGNLCAPIYLPHAIPDWIKNEIKRLVPSDKILT